MLMGAQSGMKVFNVGPYLIDLYSFELEIMQIIFVHLFAVLSSNLDPISESCFGCDLLRELNRQCFLFQVASPKP